MSKRTEYEFELDSDAHYELFLDALMNNFQFGFASRYTGMVVLFSTKDGIVYQSFTLDSYYKMKARIYYLLGLSSALDTTEKEKDIDNKIKLLFNALDVFTEE